MGEAGIEGFVLARALPGAPGSDLALEPVAPGHGPFRILLAAWLAAPRGSRWAVIAGSSGPAGETVGVAREALAGSARPGFRIAVRTGDPGRDRMIGGLVPSLAALLGNLTDRQRLVAGLLLVERRRRAEIATILGISRPTVSVMVERAHLPEIDALVVTLDELVAGA